MQNSDMQKHVYCKQGETRVSHFTTIVVMSIDVRQLMGVYISNKIKYTPYTF